MTDTGQRRAARPGVGALRLARAVAVALVCAGTAGVGHTVAGGDLALGPLAVVLCTATAVAWSLASRRLTVGQLVGLLVLAQVAVHLCSPMHDMAMGVPMLAAHAVATAASAALLAKGEAFAWRVAEHLGLRVSPLVLLPALVPSRRSTPVVGVTHAPHDVRLTHSRLVRGPPVGSC